MMHGMDGHAGPSGYLARQIVEKNGLVVAALDFRNFGKTKTTDKMGYIGNVQTLIDDAESVLTLLVEKYKTNRIFLAGLSIGGAVAFRLAIRHKFPYVGIILFAPAIK
jgi:alpha-beta hydrolase superfamily lysophospholipase